jgi:hypothetical protein
MCYAIDVAKFWKASVAFPVGEVLPLLRRSAQERGFHGIRAAPGAGQLPGDRRPAAPGVGVEIWPGCSPRTFGSKTAQILELHTITLPFVFMASSR